MIRFTKRNQIQKFFVHNVSKSRMFKDLLSIFGFANLPDQRRIKGTLSKCDWQFPQKRLIDAWQSPTYVSANCNTAWKLSIFGVFLVRIFLHLCWIQRDTPYLSVFSPIAGKYKPKKNPNTNIFYEVRASKSFRFSKDYTLKHCSKMQRWIQNSVNNNVDFFC